MKLTPVSSLCFMLVLIDLSLYLLYNLKTLALEQSMLKCGSFNFFSSHIIFILYSLISAQNLEVKFYFICMQKKHTLTYKLEYWFWFLEWKERCQEIDTFIILIVPINKLIEHYDVDIKLMKDTLFWIQMRYSLSTLCVSSITLLLLVLSSATWE